MMMRYNDSNNNRSSRSTSSYSSGKSSSYTTNYLDRLHTCNVDDLLMAYDECSSDSSAAADEADEVTTIPESTVVSDMYSDTTEEDDDSSTSSSGSSDGSYNTSDFSVSSGEDSDDDLESDLDNDTDAAFKVHFTNKNSFPRRFKSTSQLLEPIREIKIKNKTSIGNDKLVDGQPKMRRWFNSNLELFLKNSGSVQELTNLGVGVISQKEFPTQYLNRDQEGNPSGGNTGKLATHDKTPKPQAILKSILSKHGYAETEAISAKSVPAGFFVEVTPAMIAAYDLTIATAVRQGDVDTLRDLHQFEQKEMQACNKFRESIVHVAARRGHTETLAYLMEYAGVRVQVCCDSGRTPLHDACWTGAPNFDCIRLLLRACPDLMLIKDHRGFGPLDYVPREAWARWNTFLEEHPHLVLPKQVVALTNKRKDNNNNDSLAAGD